MHDVALLPDNGLHMLIDACVQIWKAVLPEGEVS
jgi:hypothetical protein